MPALTEGGILSRPLETLNSMEIWDVDLQRVMPFPTASTGTILLLRGYGFFEGIGEEGVLRGRADFAAPTLFSADLGTTLGHGQYLNLDLALTSDLWTLASIGSPELLQIGAANGTGPVFLDAQPPQSSPIQGLTLSDTIALADDQSNLKLFFAPRGTSTDGPIDFMHRLTGMVNPDTPLGQADGQDVGRSSSTVLGESLKLGSLSLEASIFNGTLSDPTQVDFPLGILNSYAFRLMNEFSPQFMVMASYAWVANPEPGVADVQRYSASLYAHLPLTDSWAFHDTFIYGGISNWDNSAYLSSFLDEVLLNDPKTSLFARLELLQRTPNELQIPNLSSPDSGQWITAITVGYSHQVAAWDGWELRAGLSITNDLVPADYSDAYAGNPITYKFFFQLGGSQAYAL
jgi:hypothetical protein